MNDEEEKKIIDLYYDISQGLSNNPKQIYEKLNKKIKLWKIKEVLNRIKNKQIKSNNDFKTNFIPIIAEPNWFQADLTFFTQYKKLNSGFGVIMNIININWRFLYSYFMKNKKSNTIVENFKKFLNDCNYKINVLECDEGWEFISKEFKKMCNDNNIKLILFNKKQSPNSMAIVERVNLWIRNLINDYMISYQTKKFNDVYDKIV